MFKSECTVGAYVRVRGSYSGPREARIREMVAGGVLLDYADVTEREKARRAEMLASGRIGRHWSGWDDRKVIFRQLDASTEENFRAQRDAIEAREAQQDVFADMPPGQLAVRLAAVQEEIGAIERQERELRARLSRLSRDADDMRQALRQRGAEREPS